MKAIASTNTEVKSTSKTVTVTTVNPKVLAAIRTAILATATTYGKELAAITAREQSVIVCAKEVEKAEFSDRKTASDYLAPLFTEIYEKAKLTKEHADSQRSRVVTFAFPGGVNANPKQAEKAKAALEVAMEYVKPNGKKLVTNELLPIARGNAKLNAKTGEVEKIRVGGSGGSNAKKPLEAFDDKVALASTGLRKAKIDADQVAVIIVKHLKTEGFTLEELKEAFDAATEA